MIEGLPKSRISDTEAIETLMQIADRMGYSRQERGYKPVLIFITDKQYADVKHVGYDVSEYITDYLSRAIDCAGSLVDDDDYDFECD